MRKNRFSILLLLVVFAFAAAACGGSPAATATSVPATQTTAPTEAATVEATAAATTAPTAEATVEPTTEATAEPTKEATAEPTTEATAEPTTEATAEPTKEATAEPTKEPTAEATKEALAPTEAPTEAPTVEPTKEPTKEPTAEPTKEPTKAPTVEPTVEPTKEPTKEPTAVPPTNTSTPIPVTQAPTETAVPPTATEVPPTSTPAPTNTSVVQPTLNAAGTRIIEFATATAEARKAAMATPEPTAEATAEATAAATIAVTEAATAAPTAEATAPAACRSTGELIVGTDAAYPPFENINTTTNEFEGFDIDLLNAVAAKAGFTVKYENAAFDPIFINLASGQFDIVISAATITEERMKTVSFSNPYFAAGQVIVVRKDDAATIKTPEDLAGKTIGVQLGTTGAEAAKEIKDVTVKEYQTAPEAFQALANKDVDAVVNDNVVSLTLILNRPELNLVVTGDPFTVEYYGIAVRMECGDLLTVINTALEEVIKDGTYEEIYKKYLGEAPTKEFRKGSVGVKP